MKVLPWVLERIGSLAAGNVRWTVGKKNISVRYYFLFEWLRAFLVGRVYAAQHSRIRALKSMTGECLPGRGLVDDPLSLSNETRCRDGVSRSTALSDTLWGIGRAARETVGGGRRVSDVEGISELSKVPLFIRRLVAERPTGDERR